MRFLTKWHIMTGLALLISLYAFTVFMFRIYPTPLADSFIARPWGIYSHAFCAMFGLAVGPWQFRGATMKQRNKHHKSLGKLYVASAFGTSLSGFYMAFYAHGTMMTKIGFGLLAIALFVTTTGAYQKIRQRDFAAHRAWMLRSYAMMFSAVTLRLWLPILITLYRGDFSAGYQWVAWLCWIPNLIWAEWYLAKKAQTSYQ